ncbi:hypothetical protein D3C84_1156120 [compost metagenome]
MVAGEKQEGLFGGKLIAHEHQRDHRRQQQQHRRRFQRFGVGQLMQALAEGAVADLVVVLQKQHERSGWQMPAGLAA